MSQKGFENLKYRVRPVEEMQADAAAFAENMNARRTVRDFSDRPVPRDIIENCLRAAGTAPSGANRQPWHFVVISNSEVKHQIRLAAEKEEREFYRQRAPAAWLEALSKLGTDEHKPFLERAPYLIAIFSQRFATIENDEQTPNYYVMESVGIATGLLIAALHNAGLASLTHTPSPMGFLNDILGRPPQERPFLLLVVGYPEEEAQVPNISRKSLSEISSWKD